MDEAERFETFCEVENKAIFPACIPCPSVHGLTVYMLHGDAVHGYLWTCRQLYMFLCVYLHGVARLYTVLRVQPPQTSLHTVLRVQTGICALWQSVGSSAFSPVSLLALTRHGSFT